MLRPNSLAVLLLWGCAEGGAEGPSSADSKSTQGVLDEHAALEKQLAAVPAEDREACELHAGDCLVLVKERREQLVSTHGLSACGAGPEQSDDCLFRQLLDKGRQQDVNEYVKFKNWCSKELLACTEDAEVKAKAKEVEARAVKRKQAIEISPPVLEQWNGVEAARDRATYLRATLPPKAGEGVCEIAEVAACQQEVQKRLQAFEPTLAPDQFDEAGAIAAYAEIKRAEAACFAPEEKCLLNALTAYAGAFPETRKVMDRNFAAIAERAKLASTAPAEAQASCLTDLEGQHAAAIDQALQAYARDPVLFFRLRLDKAYLALHQAQIACLTRNANAPAKPGKGDVISLD